MPFSSRSRQLLGRDNMRNELMRPLTNVLSADILESPTDFHVQVDLPGIEMANLDVSISNNCLVIRADRKRMDDRGTSWFGGGGGSEVCYGQVQRTIPIPEGANFEIADAKFENGVLTIVFPKKEGFSGSKKLVVKCPGVTTTPPTSSSSSSSTSATK